MSVALGSSAAVLYSQPHNGTGTINLSSWVFENGSDADMYAYDSFIIPTGGAVDRVTWRGGYQYNAMYGSVNNFSIYFYESTAGGTEPHVNNPQLPEFYLARYLLNGIAGETPAGTFGGKAMTYYGRWTYKYEVAAEKGAAACLMCVAEFCFFFLRQYVNGFVDFSGVLTPAGHAVQVKADSGLTHGFAVLGQIPLNFCVSY